MHNYKGDFRGCSFATPFVFFEKSPMRDASSVISRETEEHEHLNSYFMANQLPVPKNFRLSKCDASKQNFENFQSHL